MKENKLIAVNAQTWDKFNLPLLEAANDTSFYTINEFKQEVDKRIKKLITAGSRYSVLQRCQIKYEFIEYGDRHACIEPTAGEHNYSFKIVNVVARKRNEKYLDTLIYHELCHIVQIETLVDIGLMEYDSTGVLSYHASNKDAVATLFFKNDFHTVLWDSLAWEVNSVLKVNPPIAKFLDPEAEVDLFLESTFKPDLADELITLPDLCIAEYRRCSRAADKKANSKD